MSAEPLSREDFEPAHAQLCRMHFETQASLRREITNLRGSLGWMICTVGVVLFLLGCQVMRKAGE